MRPGPDGVHGTADDAVSNFSTSAFGSTDPEGVEYDPATGRLFVCDGAGIEIYASIRSTAPSATETTSSPTSTSPATAPATARAWDSTPSRNALLAVDWRTDAIYELSMGGATCGRFSLSAIPTSSSLVADVTMAPSSNPNDSPSAMNYWIVDRHVDNKASNPPPRRRPPLRDVAGRCPPPPRTRPSPSRSRAPAAARSRARESTAPATAPRPTTTASRSSSTAHRPSARASAAGAAPAPGALPAPLTMDADKQATATSTPRPSRRHSSPCRSARR